MSALARFILGGISSIATSDETTSISSQRRFSRSSSTFNTPNCNPTSAQIACITELSGQIRRNSLKLNIDTERGKKLLIYLTSASIAA